jgi:N-acetylmuramoyl-L-alanine amidase
MGTSCSSASTFKRAGGGIVGILLGGISLSAFANLEEGQWIFHLKNKDHSFSRAGEQRGTPLVCLPELQKKLKFKIKFNPETFEVRISNRQSWAQFTTYSPDVKGSVRIHAKDYPFETRLSKAPVFIGSKLCVPTEFGDRVLRPVIEAFPPDTLPLPSSMASKHFQVLIDAGHGGNDFGAHRKVSRLQHFREKDFSLQFAKELQESLMKENVSAALTRESDHFLTLPERSELANASQAKLFISLHMNSSENAKTAGYELYVLSLAQTDSTGRAAVARENQVIPTDLPSWLEKALADLRAEANLEASLRWAKIMDEALRAQLKLSSKRRIRMGPFYILYGAAMPAVLLELGYLTNKKDRNRMLDPLQRQKLADGLAKKIASQFKEQFKE